MRAHVVLAHPEKASFNGQLANLSRLALEASGWRVTVSDLYAMDFDPREGPRHYAGRKNPEVFHVQTEQRHGAEHCGLPAEVDAEIERLLQSELLVVHFPLWWFGMPAILKGWMDRVFVYGRMYRSAVRYDRGVCTGKRVIACITTGASADSCAFNGREGDTQLHLWPILFPFRYLGFDVLEPEVLHGVGGVAFIEENEAGLNTLEIYRNRWTETLTTLDSRPAIEYNRDTDFDDSKRLIADAPEFSPFIRHHPDPLRRKF